MPGNARIRRRRNLVASSVAKKDTIRPIVQMPNLEAVKENPDALNAAKKAITRQIVPTLEKVVIFKKNYPSKFWLIYFSCPDFFFRRRREERLL